MLLSNSTKKNCSKNPSFSPYTGPTPRYRFHFKRKAFLRHYVTIPIQQNQSGQTLATFASILTFAAGNPRVCTHTMEKKTRAPWCSDSAARVSHESISSHESGTRSWERRMSIQNSVRNERNRTICVCRYRFSLSLYSFPANLPVPRLRRPNGNVKVYNAVHETAHAVTHFFSFVLFSPEIDTNPSPSHPEYRGGKKTREVRPTEPIRIVVRVNPVINYRPQVHEAASNVRLSKRRREF